MSDQMLSRRRLIGTGAAAGLGAMLKGVPAFGATSRVGCPKVARFVQALLGNPWPSSWLWPFRCG